MLSPDALRRYRGFFFILALGSLIALEPVPAQGADGNGSKEPGSPVPTFGPGPTALNDSLDRDAARRLVEEFVDAGAGRRLTDEQVDRYAVGEFADHLRELAVDQPSFAGTIRFSVGEPRSIRPEGSAAIVPVAGVMDTLPRFGVLSVDWVFFLTRTFDGEWKIESLRRQARVDDAISGLRYIDTTADFPASLKPAVARETGAFLLSNAQLREHFAANRDRFQVLLRQLSRPDSLRIVGREGDHPTQINMLGMDWGMASHDVPEDVVREFLATAQESERETFTAQLRYAERLRMEGYQKLAKYAHESNLSVERIDSVVSLMKDLRLIFANAEVPWSDGLILTVAGRHDDAFGFLYSPQREIPWITPTEYFYLEELGDGWWIYRST